MRELSRFLSGAVSLWFLLNSLALASPVEKEVISVPHNQLKTLRALVPGADILGMHKGSETVQIRLSQGELSVLEVTGFPFTRWPDHSLVAHENLGSYKSPEEVGRLLQELAERHPDLALFRETGRTHENRPIYALELGSREKDRLRPAILFNGMHHAREVMTTEIILDIAEYLLNSQEAEIRSWLAQYRIILVPQVNPDGGHRVHGGDRWWRKNAWKSGSTVWGVDLNRNYPALWNACKGSSGSVFAQDYRGPEPASEPETQAMMALVEEIQPVFNISYHSYSELIIYPYGCERERNPSTELFKRVAEAMASEIRDDRGRTGTYQIGTAPELLYQADGTDLDYQWQEHNVIAYTLEVNARSQGFQPDYGQWRDKTVAAQRGGWMTLLRRMEGGGVRADFDPGSIKSLVLEMKTPSGYVRWDQGRREKTSLRQERQLYQLLADGSYRLKISRKDDIQQQISFQVSGKLVDLGHLR